jgi:hypothetical protein
MPSDDPIRATFLAILRQLNRAETENNNDTPEQALELAELERRLSDFWAIEQGSARVPQALGLLLMNKMVAASGDTEYSWQRQRNVSQRYQITSEGKKFLLENIEKMGRVE